MQPPQSVQKECGDHRRTERGAENESFARLTVETLPEFGAYEPGSNRSDSKQNCALNFPASTAACRTAIN
jgi:hypothetical protein